MSTISPHFTRSSRWRREGLKTLVECYGPHGEKNIAFNQLSLKTTDSSTTDAKLMELYESGQAHPVDAEFEDYSQGIQPASGDNTHHSQSPQLFKKSKQVRTANGFGTGPWVLQGNNQIVILLHHFSATHCL